jgi:hypothetical protein
MPVRVGSRSRSGAAFGDDDRLRPFAAVSRLPSLGFELLPRKDEQAFEPRPGFDGERVNREPEGSPYDHDPEQESQPFQVARTPSRLCLVGLVARAGRSQSRGESSEPILGSQLRLREPARGSESTARRGKLNRMPVLHKTSNALSDGIGMSPNRRPRPWCDRLSAVHAKGGLRDEARKTLAARTVTPKRSKADPRGSRARLAGGPLWRDRPGRPRADLLRPADQQPWTCTTAPDRTV